MSIIKQAKAIDLFKEYNIGVQGILKDIKPYFSDVKTFDVLMKLSQDHEILYKNITDLEALFCLCGFYDVYIYRSRFYFELSPRGQDFKSILKTLSTITDYPFIQGVDSLCEVKLQFLEAIYSIIEKYYVAENE